MNDFIPLLNATRLFSGIEDDEITAMLSCLDAKKERFPKDAFLLRAGETTDSIGLLLSGSVLMIHEDIWGNRNLLSKVEPGETFAAAYACASNAILNVSAVAETPVFVLTLNVKRVLTVCSSACEHHSRIIRNLLGELAEKNLRFGEKLTHMGQRTTRDKVLSYLSAEAQRLGSCEFDIPFSRQQLADYLAVDRSGLSYELGKLRDEGLLEFRLRHFLLNSSKK